MSTPPRTRLGKGLGALLGETAVDAVRDEGTMAEVAVQHIKPNRFQPRRTFDEDAIAELATSIAAKGVLQPLIVTRRGGGAEYELVSGERRLRAARHVGLATVPVIVREMDDREMLEIALIENLQREDLDAIEEARGFQRLVDEFDVRQSDLAQAVGKSRPAVANTLRLLELPNEVQNAIRERVLSAGHGRAMLGLASKREIAPLARETARRQWSVRQVERRVKKMNAAVAEGETVGGSATAAGLERTRMEEALQERLGTRVSIRVSKNGRGRIEIAFYSPDDLERILDQLGDDRS